MDRFLKYYNYTKSWAMLTCHDEDLAKDLTQQVFLKISKYTDHKEFLTDGHIKAYLKLSVRNEYITHYRKNADKVFIDIDQDYYSENIPEEKIDELLSDEISYALERLYPKLRDPFILSYLYEYKEDDVSKILSIPNGTVKNRNFRAKAELRKSIEEFRKYKKGSHEPL